MLRGFLGPVIVFSLSALLAPSNSIAQCPPPGTAQFTTQRTDIFAGWSVHPLQRDPVTCASRDAVIHNVSSQWTVPAVECDAPRHSNPRPWRQSRAAVWVGIWGQNSLDPSINWLAQIGTASVCGTGGLFHEDAAIAQLFHISKTGGYSTPGVYTIPVKIQPGDIIHAQVDYYGRQPDNKLKYEATIESYRNNVQTHSQRILMLTDPGVSFVNGHWGAPISEANAAWQAGLIVESEGDGNKGPGIANPYGGLAKFITPITFTSFSINNIAPELWIDTFPLYGNLYRWDMVVDGRALANTGLPGHYGQFSVTWQSWR